MSRTPIGGSRYGILVSDWFAGVNGTSDSGLGVGAATRIHVGGATTIRTNQGRRRQPR
jgi:hypothetical protein